jgi:O-Antigen ligase/Virulence factor membrane-bound polymerase, C-terminal/Protein glycosylation ligase
MAALLLPAIVYAATLPSATLANQAVALGGWGVLALSLVGSRRIVGLQGTRAGRDTAVLAAAALLWALAAAASMVWGGLPRGLALSLAGSVLAALALVWLGAAFAGAVLRAEGLFIALLAAGAFSALLGAVQALAPAVLVGDWLSTTTLPGRAVGQLRQPNHLATLLLWSIAALVPLLDSGTLSRTPLRRIVAFVLWGLLVLGLVLSGSRTGLLATGLLLLWAVVDRRLSPLSRGLLIATPLLVALLAWALTSSSDTVGIATRRIEGSDWSSSRLAIWRDTWDLIQAHPWLGVGVGSYNFAWTLSVFPQRPTAFFDHSHNLPLQLWVELGLPLGSLLLLLLCVALWQAARRSWRRDTAARTMLVLVLLMVPHSMGEYPLWYLHFLLPTAFFWGWALASEPHNDSSVALPWMAPALGAALLAAAVLTGWDYRAANQIYQPSTDNTQSLAERIARGQRSVLFAHHADYALVASAPEPVMLPGAFHRPTHFLLDTRLMIAWAQSLHARGYEDHARHIAARLREFRNPKAAEFFAVCATDTSAFQCQAPKRVLGWQDFKGL